MLRILTNNANASFSLDYFALVANRFYRRSYLHVNPPFSCLIISYLCLFAALLPHLVGQSERQQKRDVQRGTQYIIALRASRCKDYFTKFLRNF